MANRRQVLSIGNRNRIEEEPQMNNGSKNMVVMNSLNLSSDDY